MIFWHPIRTLHNIIHVHIISDNERKRRNFIVGAAAGMPEDRVGAAVF